MMFRLNPRSRLMLPLMAAFGVLMLIVAKLTTSGPQQHPDVETSVSVLLQPLTQQSIEPRVSGYGVVRPAVDFSSIAEVSARVVWISDKLNAGALIGQGEPVVRLDDTDYQLALTQARAQQHMIDAQLTELASSQRHLQQRLSLVKKKVTLAQQELQRKQNLAQQNALSLSQLDAEQQKLIGLQQEQLSLQQQLDAIPIQRDILQAQRQSAVATIQQQQRNIDRTRIVMPFNGRIRSVEVELDSFKNQGQRLFEAIGVDQVEVEAQFSLDSLRPFIELAFQPNADSEKNNINTNTTIKTTTNTSTQNTHTKADQTTGRRLNPDIADKLIEYGLKAELTLALTPGQRWQGKVVSLRESLDPNSHTLGALIRIDAPYQDIIPGKRPPLLAGMQLQASLIGRPKTLISVPLSALHASQSDQANTQLYLAYPLAESVNTTTGNISHRLKKLPLKPALLSSGEALFTPQQLASAIQQKAQLVLSDISPAIDDMALRATAGAQ